MNVLNLCCYHYNGSQKLPNKHFTLNFAYHFTLNFAYWVIFYAFLLCADFFQNQLFQNTIRLSNSLGPNCLQRSSADDTSRQRVNSPIFLCWKCCLLIIVMSASYIQMHSRMFFILEADTMSLVKSVIKGAVWYGCIWFADFFHYADNLKRIIIWPKGS